MEGEEGDLKGSTIDFTALLVLIVISGFIGNICLIVLFARRKQHFRHFNGLVITLACFDLMFLVCGLFLGGNSILGAPEEVLKWIHPFSQIALSGVIYSTVGITIERYLITCKSRSLDEYPLGAVISTLVAFTIIFNIPRFFEMEIESHDVLVTGMDLRLHPIYVQVYVVWIQFIVNYLVPFSILLILNILVLKKCMKMNQMLELEYVSSSESRLEKSVFLAKFSLGVVFMFILCYSVRWIVMGHELYLLYGSKDVVSNHSIDSFYNNKMSLSQVKDVPQWIIQTHAVSTILLTFNSSVNFYVYLIMKKCTKNRSERPNHPEELQEMKTLTSTD